MLHPLRTLLYEMLIEPMVEIWRRVAAVVSPWRHSATMIGEAVYTLGESRMTGMKIAHIQNRGFTLA